MGEEIKLTDKKFWSGDWGRIKRYENRIRNNNPDKFYKFRDREDYIPFCCIESIGSRNFKLYESQSQLGVNSSSGRYNNTFEYWGMTLPQSLLGNKKFIDYINENKHIGYILGINGETYRNKENFIELYEEFINSNPSYSIQYNIYYANRSSINVINNSCYNPHWLTCECTKVNSPNKNYLTNYLFCAEIDISRIRGFENTSNRYCSFLNPLYSMMIKKEYVPYIRACMLNNIAVNPECLELWIASELDNPKSVHPFRSHFNKVLKRYIFFLNHHTI